MSLEALYVPTADIKKLLIQLTTKTTYSLQPTDSIESQTIQVLRLKLIKSTRCKFVPALVIPIALVLFWTYNCFALIKVDILNIPENIPIY